MTSTFQFKELHLRNFLSFGNSQTIIDLNQVGSTLILGENFDTNSSNGSGKTTIINAICYALYNKPFDNISLQRLLNATNATKNTLMEVRLIFDKEDEQYEIYRCRGETYNILVTRNGEDITLDSVLENDKAIEKIIGMSYELFTKIIIFSGNSLPFLAMPLAQQRAQIEELFNITLLTEKAVRLKELIKLTEGSIAIQDAIIKERKVQASLLEKQLTDARARISKWEDDRKLKIEKLQEQLVACASLDLTLEKLLHESYAELVTQQRKLSDEINLTQREISLLQKDINKLSSELEHLAVDKCPYCLQEYAGAAERINEITEKLKSKQAKLVSMEEKYKKRIIEHKTLSSEITEIKSGMSFDSYAEAIKISNAAQTAQLKIDELHDSINPHVDVFEQLQANIVEDTSNNILDALRLDLEHQQFLLKLLTDKSSFIRRRIINKTIPFLNSRLSFFAKELGLPHVIRFDDDMSCTVSELGRELDFGNLSSGEKKRVNLSLSLSFRNVLHYLHGKFNCLFIDEIDASLDGPGVDNVFRMLKMLARNEEINTWIISHRPEAIGRFDRTLVVRKENGFSRIITEDKEETLE